MGRITDCTSPSSSTIDGGVTRGADGCSPDDGSAAGFGGRGGVIVGRSTGPTRSPIPESNGAGVNVVGDGAGADPGPCVGTIDGVGIGFVMGGVGDGGGPRDVGNVGRDAPFDVGPGVGLDVTTTGEDGVDGGGTGALVPAANVGNGVGC